MPRLALANDAPQPAAVLTKALLRAAKNLDLPQATLARIIHVSPATVSRLPQRPIDPATSEGETALLFLRIFRSLDTLFGGNLQQAQTWLRASNHHLNGQPLQLIQTLTGLVHVADYLDAMRGHS